LIGIDTNVLVRLFVDDGSRERERAIAFFGAREQRDEIFVSVVTLVEFVWLLTSRYQFTRARALDAVDALLTNAGFVVDEEQLVIQALDGARTSNSGFADNLVALIGLREGCAGTLTFDREAAKRIPGMDLLK